MNEGSRSKVAEMARNTSGRVIIKESNAGLENLIPFFRRSFQERAVDDEQVLIFEVESRIAGDSIIEITNIFNDPNVKMVEDIRPVSDNAWRVEIAVFEQPLSGILCEIRSLFIPGTPDEGTRVTFYKLGETKLREYHAMIQS